MHLFTACYYVQIIIGGGGGYLGTKSTLACTVFVTVDKEILLRLHGEKVKLIPHLALGHVIICKYRSINNYSCGP